MKLALLFFICIGSLYGQESKPCDRTSDSEQRFQNVRVLPPSRIYYDGRTITATHNDLVDILNIDKDSILHIPADYRSKKFWILFDTCSRFVYVVDEVVPKK